MYLSLNTLRHRNKYLEQTTSTHLKIRIPRIKEHTGVKLPSILPIEEKNFRFLKVIYEINIELNLFFNTLM